MSSTRNTAGSSPHGTGAPPSDRSDASGVTAEGAAWLASAGTYPRSTLALWEDRPTAPVVLACGTAFDVVNTPAIFGRRMLDRLWEEGPGSGPVAVFRGRMLLFGAPGTAQRLPSLLEWEEWGSRGAEDPWGTRDPGALGSFDDRDGFDGGIGAPAGPGGLGRVGAIPPLLCHGIGDAVTVPALRDGGTAGDGTGGTGPDPETRPDSRWLVAPDTRHPWLPGAEILVWAAVRAARAAASAAVRISIFPPADQDAKVYDVSRRR
ncbi:bifunctional DNA primase/polymerase [Streptomyces sp. NPDC002769]|uniref:bifunctional DNA primase/polymerase n=1 Tax=Streptomyces sp. NPDC002769 TaxID=3154542 RepID=UPI003323D7F7